MGPLRTLRDCTARLVQREPLQSNLRFPSDFGSVPSLPDCSIFFLLPQGSPLSLAGSARPADSVCSVEETCESQDDSWPSTQELPSVLSFAIYQRWSLVLPVLVLAMGTVGVIQQPA